MTKQPTDSNIDFGQDLVDAIKSVPELTPFAIALESITPQLASVEERIKAQARSFDPAVEGYVSYVCDKGGKRLRPVLALLAGGAAGKLAPGHVDLAVIVELIHIATLVHDDIMDGADLRRDQPTANAKWGNSLSVLLGDCLFAHALRLAASYGDPYICERIAEASAEVCSGEIIQTQRRYDLKLSTADYYRIVEMKTAALFSVACELGGYISEASSEVIAALKNFGTKIGIAYQIYDDCLDLAGTEEETGKTLGTDIQKGKFTLPILIMLNSKETDDLGTLRDLLLGEKPFDDEKFASMLERSGCVKTAAGIAQEFIDEARSGLEALPENRYVTGLQAITDHITRLVQKIG